jgi:hypothetical protein
MAKFTKYTGSNSGKTFYKLTMGPKEAAAFASFVENAPFVEGNLINNSLDAVLAAIYNEVILPAEFTHAKVA